MTLLFIQELIDTARFIFYLGAGFIGYHLWPPLWILFGTMFVYYFLFTPVISDSFAGFMIGPCRYDIYVHGKNEWDIL